MFLPKPGAKGIWMLMVDAYTKFIEAIELENLEAYTAWNAFYKFIICRYGLVDAVVSNNGGEYEGTFHEQCLVKDIKHIYITPYNS